MHQLSMDGAGLRGSDVDSVNFGSNHLVYVIYVSMQVKTGFITKEHQLQIDLTFGERL
jgi:hypothetical protein